FSRFTDVALVTAISADRWNGKPLEKFGEETFLTGCDVFFHALTFAARKIIKIHRLLLPFGWVPAQQAPLFYLAVPARPGQPKAQRMAVFPLAVALLQAQSAQAAEGC